MTTVSLKKTTLRSETDERNKIQKIEKHFRNHRTRPLCNQPIQLATLSAPTEMPMGQTTVKPFAISDFDSPTFFKGEIKTRMGPLLKAKKEAVAFVGWRWSLPMVDSDGQLDGQREQSQRTVQVAASRRLLWCYVGNWKKRAFLPWESVCEPGFLETQERYLSSVGLFSLLIFVLVCF